MDSADHKPGGGPLAAPGGTDWDAFADELEHLPADAWGPPLTDVEIAPDLQSVMTVAFQPGELDRIVAAAAAHGVTPAVFVHTATMAHLDMQPG